MVKKKKCQAVNGGGKPCHFGGSMQIGNLWLCGNHAVQATARGNHKEQAIIPSPDSNEDHALLIAEAIDKLYQSALATPEVVAAILRNVFSSPSLTS